MAPVTSRRRFLACAGAAGLAATAGCSWIERDERETIQRRYGVDGVAAVGIESGTGNLAVRSAQREGIRVEGVKRAASEDALDALTLSDRRDGDRLEVESDVGSGPWPIGWWRPPRLHLDVEVPQSVRLHRAVTDAGDLEVEGTVGPLAAQVDTGDCYVANVGGAVDARTDTGALIVRDATGPIAARTDTGDLTVDGAIAGLRTDTGAISTTVRGVEGAPTIRTDTGDVDLAVSRSLDVTVSVAVDTGSIEVHGDGASDVSTSGNSGTVVLGDGSGELSVETGTGDVSVSVVE